MCRPSTQSVMKPYGRHFRGLGVLPTSSKTIRTKPFITPVVISQGCAIATAIFAVYMCVIRVFEYRLDWRLFNFKAKTKVTKYSMSSSPTSSHPCSLRGVVTAILYWFSLLRPSDAWNFPLTSRRPKSPTELLLILL